MHNLAGGTITSTTAAPTSTIGTPFTNSGTLTVNAGTFRFGAGATQDAGTATVAAGATLGTLGTTLTLGGGALTGAGTVAATVDNTGGTIRPGSSPGVLTFGGDLTLGPGGTVEVEVAGAAPGTGHDRVAVDGTATLDGTLALATPGPFEPPAGSTYDVLTAGTVTGTFATLAGATFGFRHYEPQYAADKVSLLVVQDPLPPPPENTVAPSIAATATLGDALTCAPGQWTGSPTFAYEWLRNGAPIGGATGTGYAVKDADVANAVSCRVTGTNPGGSSTAVSNAVTPTGAAASADPDADPGRHGDARPHGDAHTGAGRDLRRRAEVRHGEDQGPGLRPLRRARGGRGDPGRRGHRHHRGPRRPHLRRPRRRHPDRHLLRRPLRGPPGHGAGRDHRAPAGRPDMHGGQGVRGGKKRGASAGCGATARATSAPAANTAPRPCRAPCGSPRTAATGRSSASAGARCGCRTSSASAS